MSMFHGWENFYMMAGTAAATLAGLLFVVITLSVSLAATPAAGGVHAFVTPVLVHFGGVLFLSLVLLAPWPAAWPLPWPVTPPTTGSASSSNPPSWRRSATVW